MYKAVQILGSVKQVFCLVAVSLAHQIHVLYNMEQVHRININSSAHSRSADIQPLKIFIQPVQPLNIPFHHSGISFKRLAQTNGDRILKLSPANFYYIIKFHGFLVQCLVKPFQFFNKRGQKFQNRQLSGRGDYIIGGLGHIYMVIGMDNGIITLFSA